MAHKTNNPPEVCTGGGLCGPSGDSVEGADGPLTAKPETLRPSASRMTVGSVCLCAGCRGCSHALIAHLGHRAECTIHLEGQSVGYSGTGPGEIASLAAAG